MEPAFLTPPLAGSPSLAHTAPIFLPWGNRCMVGGYQHFSAGLRGKNGQLICNLRSSQAWPASLNSLRKVWESGWRGSAHKGICCTSNLN